MKDRIAKSVFWIAWSRGGVQTISFVTTLLVARWLQPADYGVMALAGIWTNTIALVAEMGLGAAIIQFRDVDEGDLNACFWLTMGVAVIGYGMLYGLAPTLAVWFATPVLTAVLRVAGLTLPLTVVRIVPDSLLRKQLALDKVSQAEILSTVMAIPIVVGLAWSGAGVWALVAGVLVGPLMQSIATFWFVQWWPTFSVGGRQFRKIMTYSVATLGTKICVALYQQSDTFVLGKVSGDIALGFFSMAKQLATLPVSKVTAVINQVAIPVLAELQADPTAMRHKFLRGLRLVVSITTPLSIGILLVASDLVQVALTDKWTSSVPLLQVLCLFAVIRSIDVLFPPVLMARYRANFLFGYTVSLLIILPACFWVGAYWWGAMGVAMSWVVVYPMVMFWMMHEALLEIGVSWSEFWRQVWSSVVATVVMLGTVLTVQWCMAMLGVGASLGRLILYTLVGISAYLVVLLKLDSSVVSEIKEVIIWVFPARRPTLASQRVTP